MRPEQVGDTRWRRLDHGPPVRRLLLASPDELVDGDVWRALPFYPQWTPASQPPPPDRPFAMIEIARSPAGAMIAYQRTLEREPVIVRGRSLRERLADWWATL